MQDVIDWLLDDDEPALLLQVKRDLLKRPPEELAGYGPLMTEKGWVRQLLDERRPDGHWGNGVYNPKWTCTHYVLFELMQLNAPRTLPECRESVGLLFGYPVGRDGGINYARTVDVSDVCINGMILSMGCYFGADRGSLDRLVDYLLSVQMDDGGWNCEYHHGARHSSLHTTMSVFEGLNWYLSLYKDKTYDEITASCTRAAGFILDHELYKRSTTGEVIRDEFLKFTFPVRWKYDILRCLDVFRAFAIPYDARMNAALTIVRNAASRTGCWKAASQAGKTYFIREKNGSPGKWNTLRALRVLDAYGTECLHTAANREAEEDNHPFDRG